MSNIFITGASTGIGLSLATRYAKAGHNVGICARDINKLPHDFLTNYPNISFYSVDVTDKISLNAAISSFTEKHDQCLDILIANAGRSTGRKEQIPNFDTVENIVDINFKGVINTFAIGTDIFLKQQQGQLVAIASVAGFVGLPGAAAYSSSKAAVLALCESLAIDFPKYGIYITAIAPGFIDTPLTQKNDHKMPFMMHVDKATRKIEKAIANKKALYIFPWQMRLLITFAKIVPRSWYRKLMQLEFFNYSRGF